MKVYISTDMEGATGICCEEQCRKGSVLYDHARTLFLGDVNAAIRGAVSGGAAEIIVSDTHGGSFNLPLELVHPAARVVYGTPHRAPRLPLLDETVDLMFLIGYHARSGTALATLEHTLSFDRIARITVNGKEIGEVGIDAGLAGSVGVPVVLVTGDDKVCSESKTLLGAALETVEVKKGLGRERAACMSAEMTTSEIFEAAKRAVALKGKVNPLNFGSPVDVVVTYRHTGLADGIGPADPGVKRVDGVTVAYHCNEFADWLGGMWQSQ